MHHHALFFTQLVVLAIIGTTHLLALKWYLYWHYIWLDLPVHFLGGMWLAMMTVWILARTERTIHARTVFSLVIAGSVGWELFELWAGVPIEDNFVLDTTLDFCMDALGGIAGYYFARALTRPVVQ